MDLHKTNKYVGLGLMFIGGIEALTYQEGGKTGVTLGIAEVIAGSSIYLSAYLGEIRDALARRNINPSELETKVGKE